MSRHINLNTGLLGFMLGLGAWNLRETILMGKLQAKLEEAGSSRDKTMNRIEEDIKLIHQRLQRLEGRVAFNQRQNPNP